MKSNIRLNKIRARQIKESKKIYFISSATSKEKKLIKFILDAFTFKDLEKGYAVAKNYERAGYYQDKYTENTDKIIVLKEKLGLDVFEDNNTAKLYLPEQLKKLFYRKIATGGSF